MNMRYLLLIVSVLCVSQIEAKENSKLQHEKSVRGELHMLLEKKDPSKLTLQEVRRVRVLMREFKKIDKKGAEHLTDMYIRPEDQCCFELSPFEEREMDLELKNLFDHPKPKDAGWNHKVKKFLDTLGHAAYGSGCGSTDEDGNELPMVGKFKAYTTRYKKITGHEYKS